MALVLQHLSKRYGSVVALRDANLSVEPGEIHALFGGNGSGKSTIAKILGGSVSNDSGMIQVDGEPIVIGSPAISRSARIAVTYQEGSLLRELTVAENLALGGIPSWAGIFTKRAVVFKRAVEWLKKVGLEHLAGLPVYALRPGEKYLVELAKAISLEPRYLVLDEITSGLHHEEVDVVKRLVEEMSASGCGVVFISHRIDEIYALCKRATIIRNGETVADVNLSEVEPGRLVDIMMGREHPKTVGRPTRVDKPAPYGGRNDRTSPRLDVQGLRVNGKPFSFDVYPGEILGLGGLPDQGQVQTINCIFGYEKPRAPFRLRIDGKPAQIQSPNDAIRWGIGYVSGDRGEVGFAIRTVQENVLASSVNLRKGLTNNNGGTKATLVESILSQLAVVYHKLSSRLDSLSGGNQQKVILARWVALKPKILLAVDCTKGVDVEARQEIHELFRRLAREEKTSIILTSSDDQEMSTLCDRIIVMDGGEIIATLEGAAISESALISAYVAARR